MLNYVWLGLLIFGIGAALSSDISDQVSDRYRNGEPLQISIQFHEDFNPDKESIYKANLLITADSFNRFYRDSVKNNLSFPAQVTYIPSKSEGSIVLTVPASAPPLWRKMAEANGEKKEISGKVFIKKFTRGNTAEANLILEKISFLKLKDVTNAAIEYAGIAVKIALGLIGIMALWLGVMKVAEDAGLIAIIARWLKPVTKKLFPDVPAEHPAMGSMIMNISANMLGLGNAATPFGLRAMEELDELNPNKGTATNAMVTFLAINTAGLTLIPATAIAVRASSGSSDPAIIIGTSIFGAACATVAGVTAAKILEKFPLKSGEFFNRLRQNLKIIFISLAVILLITLATVTGIGSMLLAPLSFLTPDLLKNILQILSALAIPAVILFFLTYGAVKKVKVYEQFVVGAKEGFNIAVKIIPYLVAMLMAIGIFRAGGAMNWLVVILEPFTKLIGMPAEALPMALMRPLSGSGSLGIMTEIMSVHGPDSFIGVMVSTFYGSTETTFYVLAVYFGAINIKNIRHALAAGLIADVAGILGAVFIVRLLFGLL